MFVSKVSDLHMKCSFWLTSRPQCGPSWWKTAGNCRLLTCTQIASRGAFAVGSIRKHGIRESVFEAEIWMSSSCLHSETALLKEKFSVHLFSWQQYLLKTSKRRTKMWVRVIALCRCTTLFCFTFCCHWCVWCNRRVSSRLRPPNPYNTKFLFSLIPLKYCSTPSMKQLS